MSGTWLDADDSMAWRREDVGKVTPRGNILGASEGTAISRGIVWMKEDEAKLAEPFGWQLIPDSRHFSQQTGAWLVKVVR